MNESRREINRVESVLKSLPKIYDERSDQAIFLRLNEAIVFQVKKRKQFHYLVVSVVTIMIFTFITSAIVLNDWFGDRKQLSVSRKDEMRAQEVSLHDEDYVGSNYTISVHNEAAKSSSYDEFFNTDPKYADISIALNSLPQGVISSERKVPDLDIAIPKSVQFEKIEERNGQLLLTFTDETILKNNKQFEKVISAILVTAEDFDFQTVRFQNSDVDVVGPYDLNETIAVSNVPDDNKSE